MGNTVVLYGTDGNGGWIEPETAEWPESELGRLVRYRGRNMNTGHDWNYRKKYHGPLFEQRIQRSESAMLVEWWVSEQRRGPFSTAPRNPPQSLVGTQVHYDGADEAMWAALRVLQYLDRRNGIGAGETRFEMMPDLTPSAVPHEVVVETVAPVRSRKGKLWMSLLADARRIPYGLSSLSENLHWVEEDSIARNGKRPSRQGT